jgi:hypothetical protein
MPDAVELFRVWRFFGRNVLMKHHGASPGERRTI